MNGPATTGTTGMIPARPLLVVVDDEAEVLQSVHDLFRREYRVMTFERGPDALAALAQADPHVVLSDQRMPGMSGVELLGRVKQVRPEATRLLFTGYADIRAVIDAINQGNVFRYIAKPWDPEELATVVRQAREHHDLLVERQRLIGELTDANVKLKEANRLKGAFIEVASHELNTPVSVVLGMTELWRMAQAPGASDSEKGWVDRIHGAGKRLAATVERMLKLLRADQLDRPLDLAVVELEPLMAAAVANLRPFLLARRQEVDVTAEPGLGSAEVDAAKVGDILTNLLINAIKFTPDGGRIALWAGPVGEDRVRFRVADPGIGIGAEERRHLFEPFFTGYDTMHHSSGEFQYCKRGVGLGLCLVKAFVELHGGGVDVVSAPGEGSTFSFTLPRKAGASGAGNGKGPEFPIGSGS